MRDLALLAILAGGAYRLTRLITLDSILDGPRAAWWRRFPPEHHPLGQLIACPWCIGAWAAAAVVGLTMLWESVPLPVLVWAATSTAVGFLGEIDR